MKKILETTNLTKKYKEVIAVNEVNMTIYEGDIYGFIGENGAGKSTVIRLITNIAKPTSGGFEINLPQKLGQVAAIVETPAIHSSLTAIDNLSYQATMLGLKKSKEELEDLLREVSLEEVINLKKKAKDFSLGMKQRLTIALALMGEPKLILLDEPMNGLDPVGIKKMRDLILKLNKDNKITFLISSHLLMELDRVATKYGFISRGKLIKEVSAEEIHQSGLTIEEYYLETVVGGRKWLIF